MPSSKAQRQKGGGPSRTDKKKKKKPAPDAQDAGQPSGSGGSAAASSNESKKSACCSSCCSCCRRRSPHESCCSRFLSCLGLKKRKPTDDMVRFDEGASMESALLWSKDGTEVTAEDYLEFLPEHEQGLAESVSKVPLPKPPEDRTDY